jgi:hypothetical protein
MAAARRAVGAGVAEGALGVEPVHLTDLAIAVLRIARRDGKGVQIDHRFQVVPWGPVNTRHLRSRADLILFGGRVLTLDGAAHVAEAVARVARTTNEVIAPAQRLTREEALRAATLGGAYLTFEEDVKGTIEVDKTCAETGIRDITADVTVVGGRIVHERAQA